MSFIISGGHLAPMAMVVVMLFGTALGRPAVMHASGETCPVSDASSSRKDVRRGVWHAYRASLGAVNAVMQLWSHIADRVDVVMRTRDQVPRATQ